MVANHQGCRDQAGLNGSISVLGGAGAITSATGLKVRHSTARRDAQIASASGPPLLVAVGLEATWAREEVRVEIAERISLSSIRVG